MRERIRQFVEYITANPGKLYLSLAIPATLGFALLTPPFLGPDEDTHFVRIYQVANGDLMPTVKHDIARAGDDLPIELGESISDAAYEPNIRGISSRKYDLHNAVGELNDRINNPSKLIFYDTTATYTYNPLTYLIYAISIFPVAILNGPPVLALYIARIFMALLTVAIFYLAINIFPSRKMLLAFVFLTPMLLFQQAVVSVDGFSYAILALFLAYVAKKFNAKSVTKQDWLRLGVLIAVLSCVKPLLFLFVPVVFILVKKKRDILPAVSALAIAVIVVGGWLLFLSLKYHDVSVVPTGVDADPVRQIEVLKDRPLRALRIAWNTYTTSYGDDQLRSTIGTLGTVDVLLPLWVIFIFAGSLLLGVVIAGSEARSSRVQAIPAPQLGLVLGIMALYFVGVDASLYAAYAPVGFDILYGVQGRYFLPLLIAIPFLVIGRGVKIETTDEHKLRLAIIGAVAFCVAFSLFALFQRYYLYTP